MSLTIEMAIAGALEKIGARKESSLCRFLPSDDEGHMHHHTMRKLKKNNPEKLKALLQEFILDAKATKQIDPKPRVRRNPLKKQPFQFDQQTLDKIIQMATEKGDKELLKQLRSKLPFSSVKREFLRSIKENKIDERLWENYKESLLSLEKI